VNFDPAWWFGAPALGGGVLAASILSPRLRRDRNRGTDVALPAGVLPVVERTRNRNTAPAPAPAEPIAETVVAQTDATEPAALEASAELVQNVEPIEADTQASTKFSFQPRLAKQFAGVRNLVRRAQRVTRGVRNTEEPSVIEKVHAEMFGGEVLEGAGHPEPYTAQAAAEPEAVAAHTDDATHLAAPDLAIAEPIGNADDAPAMPPEPLLSASMDAVVDDDAAARASVAENGIIDLNQIPGTPMPTPVNMAEWQAATAAREAQLAEELQQAQTLREEAQRVLNEREAEAAAVAHQRALETAAVVEDTRVRAEARMRKWYARLDLDIDVPTVKERMVLATSLGSVKASWAGKMLRVAFTEEEEPRVRARIVGALATGDHLDDATPFTAAFEHGGIERAAVAEVLLPRQNDAPWVAELLLQLPAA
jgi:hypothetical protein